MERTDFLFGWVVVQLGGVCAPGAGELSSLQPGVLFRQLPSSGCPLGGDFLGSYSVSGIQSCKLVLYTPLSRAAPLQGAMGNRKARRHAAQGGERWPSRELGQFFPMAG